MVKNDKDDLIRKELYNIYNDLYKALHANDQQSIFKSSFVNKFNYTPLEVAKVLEVENKNFTKKEVSNKYNKEISDEILNISNIDSLREFYYTKLAQIFNANIDINTSSKILNSITTNELKYLYSLISSIPIKSKKNKKDIIYMIKYYFDDEARTDSMTQKLI